MVRHVNSQFLKCESYDQSPDPKVVAAKLSSHSFYTSPPPGFFRNYVIDAEIPIYTQTIPFSCSNQLFKQLIFPFEIKEVLIFSQGLSPEILHEYVKYFHELI